MRRSPISDTPNSRSVTSRGLEMRLDVSIHFPAIFLHVQSCNLASVGTESTIRRFDPCIDDLSSGAIGIIGRGLDVIGTSVSRIVKWRNTQHPNRLIRFILSVKDIEYQPEDWVNYIHGRCLQGRHLICFSYEELTDGTSPKIQTLQRMRTRKERSNRGPDGSGIGTRS